MEQNIQMVANHNPNLLIFVAEICEDDQGAYISLDGANLLAIKFMIDSDGDVYKYYLTTDNNLDSELLEDRKDVLYWGFYDLTDNHWSIEDQMSGTGLLNLIKNIKNTQKVERFKMDEYSKFLPMYQDLKDNGI